MSQAEKWGIRPLSNWGRWGKDDQLGTANFITAEVVARASKEVQRGKIITCAVPIDRNGPQFPGRQPCVRMMSLMNIPGREIGLKTDSVISDDVVIMPLQGSTQWDGLSHVGYGGSYYNGVPYTAITTERGATKNSIFRLGESLTTRGVLVDMVRYKNAEEKGHLEPEYAITVEDLDGCLAMEKVEVKSGDALLLRTGWVPHWYKHPKQRQGYFGHSPGLHLKTIEWIYDKEIACVAADNINVEVLPSGYDEENVFHAIAIRDVGLTLGEIFDFEALAADCKEDGRYTCFFVAPPLRFRGAVGSPLNPLAIK